MGGLSRKNRRRVDVILTDDSCISGLAGEFRGNRRVTDVLAFKCDDSGPGELPAGEIVISLDAAVRQARERRMKVEQEILLLVIHGLLHLGGQGDETYRDWCMMRKWEFEAMMIIL